MSNDDGVDDDAKSLIVVDGQHYSILCERSKKAGQKYSLYATYIDKQMIHLGVCPSFRMDHLIHGTLSCFHLYIVDCIYKPIIKKHGNNFII